MSACTSPLGHERLVAYWADDLAPSDADAVEAHLFECETCTAEAEGIARVAQVFRGAMPPVIRRADLDGLHARGLAIVENVFAPGVRKAVTFENHLDLMIHRLGQLELAQAERVEVIVRSESGGVMFEEMFAPFDRERGEVLIACQRHFSMMPADVVFDVRVHHAAGVPPAVSTYFIPHVFAW